MDTFLEPYNNTGPYCPATQSPNINMRSAHEVNIEQVVITAALYAIAFIAVIAVESKTKRVSTADHVNITIGYWAATLSVERQQEANGSVSPRTLNTYKFWQSRSRSL